MLINDLDKLMEEMGEKRQNSLNISSPHQPIEGMLPSPDDSNTSTIEPCTGLIEEYNALLGDIYIPDTNDKE